MLSKQDPEMAREARERSEASGSYIVKVFCFGVWMVVAKVATPETPYPEVIEPTDWVAGHIVPSLAPWLIVPRIPPPEHLPGNHEALCYSAGRGVALQHRGS
jgi:hypothetical protein